MKKVIFPLIILIIPIAVWRCNVFFTKHPFCLMMGCSGGYTFQDTAIYFAPKSRLEVFIVSNGSVPFGADIGEGRGVGKLYQINGRNDTITFVTHLDMKDTFILRGKPTAIYYNKPNKKESLYNYLDSVGFKSLNESEIEELYEMINSINGGHKSGPSQSQTTFTKIKKRTINSVYPE